ncbi:hypothetical protein BT67DRAFT_440178 [Trichocladium antarcticum]|uniref:Uncharacterized protein n=1 Tax=Trichocladium antarcticum TaxID=1450529 RepID=A0AAN6ZFJ1_9PEZI|nr:hypothetical protein BT67DRAFT_440178 [Trichocladium antarcticum]
MATDSGSAANTASTVPMPDGWTDVYQEMGGDEEWGSVNGTSAHAVVGLGLGKPTPLLGRKLGEGGVLYFLSADARPAELYFWEPETGEVFRVTDPTNLDDIKKLISANNFKAIKRDEVEDTSCEERSAHLTAFFAAQGPSKQAPGLSVV